MVDETEEPAPPIDKTRAEAQARAALPIMKHFGSHPTSVLIVSISEKGFEADCSSENLGTILLLQKFAVQCSDGAFQDALIKMRKREEAAPKDAPPEPGPEESQG